MKGEVGFFASLYSVVTLLSLFRVLAPLDLFSAARVIDSSVGLDFP